jgi:outer membrane immunogenic protein
MSKLRKSYWLTTVAIAPLIGTAFAQLASAADLPRKAPAAPPPPPVIGWAGFYVGVHGGAVNHKSTAYDLDRFGDFITNTPFFPVSVGQSETSALAGVHLGYNWQSGRFVYGLEGDFAGVFNNDSEVTFTAAALGAPQFIQTYSSELKWLSTVRGRLGMDFNSTLAYVTGGLAIAGVNNRWGMGSTDGSIEPQFAFQFVDDSTRLGWTIGGGIEHRFSPNWSFRIEGLYVDLGTSNTVRHTFVSGGGTDFGIFGSQWENTMIVGRAGLTYHWAAPPPPLP